MLRYLTFSMLCIQFLGLFCSAELDAWHADVIHRLADEQLDPIMNPNSVSTHMHTIIGGSAFGASYDYDTYANAKCSTIQIQADKSNYWVPQLYMYDPKWGSKPFISVKANMRFYYFLSRNSVKQPVAAFPKGLRIMAGGPDNNSPQPYFSYGCQVNKDLTGALASSSFNFPSSCPYGLVASLYFPQCWDGINLWLPKSAHMSYPAGDNIRHSPCPMSHPIRVPLIMMEVTWTPEGVAPGVAVNGRLAFSTGDMTGYSLHGDFVNGWDVDLLAKALNTTGCVGTNSEIAIEECSVFGKGTPYYNPSAAAACKPERGVLLEPAGNDQQVAYANLPGANAPPGLPKPSPAALNVAPFTGTDGAYQVPAMSAQNLVWPKTPGWASMGCVKSPSMITNASNYLDPKLTPERCQATCASSNKPIAVIGADYYGQTMCYCGNSISDQTQVAPLMCTLPCPGDSTKICGGKEAYEVFYAPPGTQSPTSNTTALGCLTNTANGLLTRATYSFKSFGMTTEVCMQACVDRNATWGLTTNSQNCACGTNYALGGDTYVPSDFCTSTCSGNTTEFCGSAFRSSVFNLTASGVTPATSRHPAGYQGCYTKPSSGVALSSTSWSSSAMTVGACVDGCSSLGNTYAAVSDGKVCLCGDKPNLGATLPESQCTTSCTGNVNDTCGGGLQVELYLTKNSSATPQLTASKYSADWMGCYADPAGSTSLSSYVFTSASMTQTLCKSGCIAFNYTFAGLTNGNTCGCAKTPSATKMVPAALCAVKCTGNSSATCGGGGYSDIYNVTGLAAQNSTTSPAAASGYQGCYQDNSARGLSSYSWTNNKMTTEMCRTGCQSMNYTLAGTQNGNSCFCGNQWKAGGMLPDLSCSTTCSGDKTQKCGAGWIMSLYSTTTAPSYPARPAGWMGCYTDSTSARSLPAYMFSGGMTVEVCRATCATKGYKLAGLQNSNQCFCDNTILSPKPAPVTLCAAPCSLNSTGVCGGSGAMDIYSSNVGTPGSTDKPGHLGCFKDWGPSTLYRFASDTLTPGQCNQVCIIKGYKFSSLFNGNVCQCGNLPVTSLTTASQCSSPCVGSKNETCGASNAVDGYDLSKVADTTGRIVANPDKTGYMGCFVNSLGPVLDTKLFSSSRMTNDLCVTSCRELSFSLAATFSTNNCFCGNSLNSTTADYRVLDSNCNSVCNGDNTEKCGGPYQLSVYNVASYSTANNATSQALAEGAKGCFAAGTAISGPPYKYSVGGMTTSLCRRMCRNKGFSIAALSNGNTCSCSSAPLYGTQQPSALCNTGCVGKPSEMCGSSTTVNVYDTTGAGSLPPAGSPTNYAGCFGAKDLNGKPTLSSYTTTSVAMTPGMCSSICASKGFSVSGTGLASGSSCYCGTAYPPALYADTLCSWSCSGDRSQTCGNSYLFSLYDTKSSSNNPYMRIASSASSGVAVTNSSSTSMFASSSIPTSRSSTSTLASTSPNDIRGSTTSLSSASKSGASTSVPETVSGNVTVVSAISSSGAVNSTLSITTLTSASITITTLAPLASSSMALKATSTSSSYISSNSTKSALIAMSSSARGTPPASVSSSTVAPLTSNSTSSSSPSSAATPTATSKGLTYVGCYLLPTQVARASIFNSTTLNVTNTIVTPDSCWSWCSDKRFEFSAITNGTICLCSDDITNLTANSTACSTECHGLTDSSCGGPTSFSIWKYVMPQRRKRHWRDLTVGRDHVSRI